MDSLDTDPPSDREATVTIVTYFQKLVESNISPTVGDLNISISLIRTITKLSTFQPVQSDLLSPIATIISDLLSGGYQGVWSIGGGASASELLSVVEDVGGVAARFAGERIMLETDNINMLVVNEEQFNGVDYTLDPQNSVSIPADVTGEGRLGFNISHTHL